jgi:hypothetical protein
MEKVNLAEKFSLFQEHWTPKIVGEVNDCYLKAEKFKGEFVWHHHRNEVEMFMVITGRFSTPALGTIFIYCARRRYFPSRAFHRYQPALLWKRQAGARNGIYAKPYSDSWSGSYGSRR